MDSLSIEQARKLTLLSQKLPPVSQAGSALDATNASLLHLGYVQIDTISVIQRAHHHTLWTRNPRYQPMHLDDLIKNKQAFEYWSHAAAYLPMTDYRFTLPRKESIRKGEQKHWFKRDEALMTFVLDRIKNEGPLMAKDFEQHSAPKISNKDWQSKPSKQALENLYMQGDLMITERRGFHKVYDVTERVLPADIDTRMPSPKEHARFIIRKYLSANGIGQISEMAYLLKQVKPELSHAIEDLIDSKEVIQLEVANTPYYALASALTLLNKPLSRNKLKILSPFDNLVIQRKRTKALFNFDYVIECYVPKAKRQYGYFSLPILWDGKLVARMDCKAEVKIGVLHILNLALEPSLKKIEAFSHALQKEIVSFMAFNHCHEMKVAQTVPKAFFRLSI